MVLWLKSVRSDSSEHYYIDKLFLRETYIWERLELLRTY